MSDVILRDSVGAETSPVLSPPQLARLCHATSDQIYNHHRCHNFSISFQRNLTQSERNQSLSLIRSIVASRLASFFVVVHF